MIIGTEVYLVDGDCDNNKYYYKKDDYVTITVRNYLSRDGCNIYTGRIDKILTTRNEIYLDISEDNNSKYVCIGFGEIISIFKAMDDSESSENNNTFGSDEKSMLMNTIPGLLTDILKQITINRLQCKKYHEPDEEIPQVIINP